MWVGKKRSEMIIPVAKVMGAVTKLLIFGFGAAAFRVTVENIGTNTPLVLASSANVYTTVSRISGRDTIYAGERRAHRIGTAKPLACIVFLRIKPFDRPG